MSVWKKLNKQDAFVTTYVAKKRWRLSGDDLESAGVKLLPAYKQYNPDNDNISPVIDCDMTLSGTSLGDTCLVAVRGVSIDICAMILSGSVVTT